MNGYTIISLRNTDFEVGTAGVELPGIYEEIESCTKPVLLCDFSISGVDKPGRYTVFGVDGTTFVSDPTISSGTVLLRCHVTDDDLVSWSTE